MRLTAHIDGAARGNPGLSGIGVIVFDESGSCVLEHAEFLGTATNNMAEYTALLRCLNAVQEKFPACSELNIRSDSELLVKQLNGNYRVRDSKLQKYFHEANRIMQNASWKCVVEHVPREKNKDADRLANRGIDERRI